jgi:hypothetical protein
MAPMPSVYHSENKRFSAIVIPAFKENPCTLSVYHETNPALSAPIKAPFLHLVSNAADPVDEWKNDSTRKFMWTQKLSNPAAPVNVFITDDGKQVVTLDNWHEVGYGDDVVAFYDANGQIKKYSLESFIPLPEEKKQTPVTDDNIVKTSIHFMPDGYGRLFAHSVSSRWWRENGIELVITQKGGNLFGIWLPWKNGWIFWDMHNGHIIKDSSDFLTAVNHLTRAKILKNLDTEEDKQAACRFLSYLKNPNDRILIEEMLDNESFSTGYQTRDTHLTCAFSESHLRSAADKALAVWDGKLDDFPGVRDEHSYHYLGTLEGHLNLTEIPKIDESLYVYLIPEQIDSNQWSQESFLQSLSITFDKYLVANSKKIPFRIEGITPGRYCIKTVFRKNAGDQKKQFNTETKYYTGQKGDYRNTTKVNIEILPGKSTQNIQIECDQRI